MARLPFQFNVSSPRGAPMGRRSEQPADMVGKVSLRLVPFVDGDYDQGGAYWGGGTPLFCAWNFRAVDGEMRVCYFRAASRADAKAKLPGCTFYR
jgi:hypothetical protein